MATSPWMLPAPAPVLGPSVAAPAAPVAQPAPAGYYSAQYAMQPGGGSNGLPAPKRTPTTTPTAFSYGAPALAGLQAGQAGLGAYDTKSGVVSALGAGASGAASGALMGAAAGGIGAVPGAIIGGAIGLGMGGLNAWMSVGRENQAKKERNRLLAEAKAEQARRDKIARDDAIDQMAFERGRIKKQERLDEWTRNKALIADARAKAKARQEEYIARGFAT